MDPEFLKNCTKQMESHPKVRCEEDGSFSEIQCPRHRCFCADMATGRRLNAESFPMDQRDDANCSSGNLCTMYIYIYTHTYVLTTSVYTNIQKGCLQSLYKGLALCIYMYIVQACPTSRTCSRVCHNGYQLDRNKCKTCRCKGKTHYSIVLHVAMCVYTIYTSSGRGG